MIESMPLIQQFLVFAVLSNNGVIRSHGKSKLLVKERFSKLEQKLICIILRQNCFRRIRMKTPFRISLCHLVKVESA